MRDLAARRLLACHVDDPNGDSPPEVRKALAAVRNSPELNESYEEQVRIDARALAFLKEVEVPDEAVSRLAAQVAAIPARPFNPRDPAIIAVIIGFILLVVVLTWNFLGRPAGFPPDAFEIAEEVALMDDEPFEVVEFPVGDLEDWFVLKGFDGFRVPDFLAGMQAGSAAIVKIENQPVAVVGLRDSGARLVVFNAAAFDIALPDGQWTSAQLDPLHASSVSVERGVCFLIVVRGEAADVERILRAGRR
jgi:hypothetical protein